MATSNGAELRAEGARDPALWGILAVALLLRAGLLVGHPDIPLWKDEILHYVTGVLVARVPGPLLGHWPPGYEAFLASVFRIAGPSVAAVRWVQVILSTASVALVFDLARRAAGRRAGRIAGLLCALYPSLVAASTSLYAETLFSALLVAAVWVLHRSPGGPSRGEVVAAGVLFGLACLTRSAALYFLPLWLLWLAWQRDRRGLRAAAVVCAVALATIAPWTLRNARVYGDFLLIDGSIGRTLWWAYNDAPYQVDLGYPDARDGDRRPPCQGERVSGRAPLPPRAQLRSLFPPAEQFDPRTARSLGVYIDVARGFAVRDVPAFQRCEIRSALGFAAANPGASLRRIGERVIAFWGPNSFLLRSVAWETYPRGLLAAQNYPLVKAAVVLSYTGVVLLALLAFGARRPAPVLRWIGLFTLYWAALHALALSASRYRLPLMPLLIVPAAVWLARPRLPESRGRWLAVGAAAAAFIGLCLVYLTTVLP